ncbi:hypothetical protein GGH94_004958 [Coemansia aciculifera]|uniref:Uncharacterized protein n=1 Tax=Coemansia aciculifera TaxID=417176 RepID=A0A9W8IEU3_9FUNG|nr:hypothetical protein GGH94_004958 [Coemansia aciculifera]KAJ2872018.1 hypothetical protein GGH93_004374 [Coemansia aciculifera]
MSVQKLTSIEKYKAFIQKGECFVLFAKDAKVGNNAAHKLADAVKHDSIRAGMVDLNNTCFQNEWLKDVKNFKSSHLYVMYFKDGALQNKLPDFSLVPPELRGISLPESVTVLEFFQMVAYRLRFKCPIYYPSCNKPLEPFVDNYVKAWLSK